MEPNSKEMETHQKRFKQYSCNTPQKIFCLFVGITLLSVFSMVWNSSTFFNLVLREDEAWYDSIPDVTNTINANAKAKYRNSTISILPTKKLERFEEGRGGIIIFYHVAKTGGATVRSYFQKLSRRHPSRFRFIRYMNYQRRRTSAYPKKNLTNCIPPGGKKKKMEVFLNDAQNRLKNETDNITYLWEIHGGSPGLDILAPKISKLRAVSQTHNKSFFAFTTVREPLAFSESYFNFFHFNYTPQWCEHRQYDNVTEKNILESVISHPNQQCFLLKYASYVQGMHPTFYRKCRVTQDGCDTVCSTMKDTLDWVGTTDRLSMDTLPLLQYLVGDETDTVIHNKFVSKRPPFSLNNRTKATILNACDLDQKIFDQIRSDYVLDNIYPEINLWKLQKNSWEYRLKKWVLQTSLTPWFFTR